MKSIIIAGVRCALNMNHSHKLVLEVPAGMTGRQLKVWKEAHRAEALEALEALSGTSEDTEDPA